MRSPLPLLALLAAPVVAQGKVDFASQVWPILKNRCVECHTDQPGTDGKAVKPKGGVVLDSRQGITQSRRGKVVVAGDPAASLLHASVTLPADDEDRMPPAKKGDPLTAAQADLIGRWIEQGAEFGSWTGAKPAATATAGKPAPTTGAGKVVADPLPKLAQGLAPVAADVLATFAKGPFRVESVGDGSPLLRVGCSGHTDLVDDQALQELLPLGAHITELDLGRTRVGDPGCATLAKMPRLTVLDLRQTQVGNKGVAALAANTELRVLNLFATHTGDYGLAALSTLKELRQLYVWQTEVTANAVVRLREALPAVQVVVMPDLPEPMGEAPAGNRRRQGNK